MPRPCESVQCLSSLGEGGLLCLALNGLLSGSCGWTSLIAGDEQLGNHRSDPRVPECVTFNVM